jgi:hypothetical protein
VILAKVGHTVLVYLAKIFVTYLSSPCSVGSSLSHYLYNYLPLAKSRRLSLVKIPVVKLFVKLIVGLVAINFSEFLFPYHAYQFIQWKFEVGIGYSEEILKLS